MRRKKSPHKEDIKAAIYKRGATLTQLASSASLGATTCNTALHRPIPRANRAIAEFLGVALCDLWPQWYDSEGMRIRIKPKTKSTRKKPSRHCKKSQGGFA